MTRKELQKGKRVRVTDTFLTAAPIWEGEIVDRIEDHSIEVKWDDGNRNSVYMIADFDAPDSQKKIKVIAGCEKCGGAIDTGADHGFCYSCQRVETSYVN